MSTATGTPVAGETKERRLADSVRAHAAESEAAAAAGTAVLPAAGSALQGSTNDDARLVKECLAGDERAWSELIEKYKRLIYSIPLKYGANRADAADIFQAVCVDLFCELGNVRKVESLKAWIVVVTAHKSLQWKKQQRAEVSLDSMDQIDSEAATVPAPDLMEEIEQEQCLREAVVQLPSRCRELVRLLFYHHPPLPYAEVARRLGLATGSIGFIRGRCLYRLQKTLVQMGF